MIWNVFNFRIFLDEKYEQACNEVYINPGVKNSQKGKYQEIFLRLHETSLPQEDHEIPGQFEVQLKTGRLVYDPSSGIWDYYQEIPLHMPALLNLILLKLIKLTGPRHGMFLVHSACVLKNGKAFLIPGRQGRGKTTLSRALIDCPIVNDDLSLVSLEADTGKALVFRVPAPESVGRTNPFLWEGPYDLGKILFLRREYPRGLRKLSWEEARKLWSEEGEPFLSDASDKEYYEQFIDDLLNQTENFVLSYDAGKDEALLRQISKE